MTFTVHPALDGGWHAFVAEPRLLLVADPDDTFIAAAWAIIGTDDGFQAALDLLMSRGLAAAPSFVLVEWTAGQAARIIVRGETPVVVTGADGEQRISAAGVSTWVERSLPAVTGISASIPAATPLGSAMLPLERGVSVVAAIASDGAVVQLEAGASAAVGRDRATPVAAAAPGSAPAAPASARAASAPVVAGSSAPALPTGPTAVSPTAAQPGDAEVEIDIEATVREAPEAPEATDSPEPGAAEAAGYDYLFGDTMYRNVADAAVVEPDAETEAGESGAAAAKPVDDTLHDGETVMLSDVAKARGRRRPKPAEARPAPLAPAHPVLVIAPTGVREPLTQPILMGRSPSVSKVSGGQIPRLVTIGTVDQDISRNHAQFSLEGGTVVVTDLHSRNGTMIALPGKSAQKLRAGEPTSVIIGTVVDFGGGVTVTVEEES